MGKKVEGRGEMERRDEERGGRGGEGKGEEGKRGVSWRETKSTI